MTAVSEIESKTHAASAVSNLPTAASVSAHFRQSANASYSSCVENGSKLVVTPQSPKQAVAKNENASLVTCSTSNKNFKNSQNGFRKDFEFLSVDLQSTGTSATSADACVDNANNVIYVTPTRLKFNVESENNPNIASHENKIQLSSTVCFTTAGNKPLSVSSESLNRARSLLSEIDSTCQQLPSEIPPKKVQLAGFKTASNKVISNSAAAFQKANRIMATLDDDNTFKASLPRSCTSSNQATVACHKMVCRDSVNNPMPEKPNSIVGFQTAGNKPLKISASAWKKARSFMSTVDHSPKSNENISCSSSESRLSVPSKPCKKRLSLNESSFSSPVVKPPKAKRRNSCYKPPRRTPLKDIQTTLNVNNSNSKTVKSFNSEPQTVLSKRQLGLKQDQESQIYLSDESLLKAMALFEEM